MDQRTIVEGSAGAKRLKNFGAYDILKLAPFVANATHYTAKPSPVTADQSLAA